MYLYSGHLLPLLCSILGTTISEMILRMYLNWAREVRKYGSNFVVLVRMQYCSRQSAHNTCLLFVLWKHHKWEDISDPVDSHLYHFKVRNDEVIKILDSQDFFALVVFWVYHIKSICKWDTFRMTVLSLHNVNELHGQRITCGRNTKSTGNWFFFSFSLNRHWLHTRKLRCSITDSNIG